MLLSFYHPLPECYTITCFITECRASCDIFDLVLSMSEKTSRIFQKKQRKKKATNFSVYLVHTFMNWAPNKNATAICLPPKTCLIFKIL